VHKVFCAIWHTCVVLAMIWFVLSIELTLYWNDVQGINAIDSTGQLIPFIIGVVGTAQAIKKVSIIAIKKVGCVMLHFCEHMMTDGIPSSTLTGPIPSSTYTKTCLEMQSLRLSRRARRRVAFIRRQCPSFLCWGHQLNDQHQDRVIKFASSCQDTCPILVVTIRTSPRRGTAQAVSLVQDGFRSYGLPSHAVERKSSILANL
jgi:hypothetical protein